MTDFETLHTLIEQYRHCHWYTEQAWHDYNTIVDEFVAADGVQYEFHKLRISKAAETCERAEQMEKTAWANLDKFKTMMLESERREHECTCDAETAYGLDGGGRVCETCRAEMSDEIPY